jgi:hypothetical protein
MQKREATRYMVHFVYVGVISLLCFNLCRAEKETSTKREELQRQRLAILDEVFQMLTKAYERGEIGPFSEVRDAHLSVLNARLELAKSNDDKAKIVSEMISVAEKYAETITFEAKHSATATSADVLRAKALVLEYQILRERLSE